MLILDKSYFYGEYHIPNLDEEAVPLTEVDLLLSKWEKAAFHILLGVELYNELQTHLEIDVITNRVVVKEDSDQKWKDLWNGVIFDGCDCCKTEWRGLIHYDEVLYNGNTVYRKSSPIVPYAYFLWSLDNNTHTTGTGEQRPDTKNSTWLNNVRKRTKAYNYFVTQSYILRCYAKCEFDNYCGKYLEYKTTCGI